MYSINVAIIGLSYISLFNHLSGKTGGFFMPKIHFITLEKYAILKLK